MNYINRSYGKLPVVVELLLIGSVVYTLMRFLRGTGGEKLFKGIVFILLAVWAVHILSGLLNLDLERINLLLKYFLVVVLVVSTVAFQPELRRGLMKLGVTQFRRTSLPEMEQVIEQVVDMAAILSRNQVGGLIAFERRVELGELIDNGTILDSQISTDILHTIFWPGTPLHDMGVVIRKDRIAAAGVQFPLAEHGDYDDRMLGSRHRAAIGLSKETDAVVVVISEETGHIGLAVDGRLARFLTIEQLRQQLIELVLPILGQKKSTIKKLRSWGRRPPTETAKPVAPSLPKAAEEELGVRAGKAADQRLAKQIALSEKREQ